MHVQQSVYRTSASSRLSHSFVNLDLCVEDGFFFFFGVSIHRLGPIFSLPPIPFDLTCTPTMPDSSRHPSSISLTTAPGAMSTILFAKQVSIEHLVSYPRPLITSRREENIKNKPKVFSTPVIDSQPASSCLINPHLAAAAVEVSRGAVGFLATESAGNVLLPRLMTRIVGHVLFH